MRLSTALLVCLVWIATAAPAAAGGFFDLYAGGAFTQDDRESLRLPGFAPRTRLSFKDSAVFGARIGAWGEGRLPYLGGALDISGFQPDGKNRFGNADLSVVPISLVLMGRVPLLTSDRFPEGQVQPYVGVGPSLVISRIDAGIGGSDFEDIDADPGLDVRGGLRLVLAEPIALFVEYRFLHFEPDYNDRVLGVRGRVSPEISTHFVQTGISFQF